MVRALNWGVIRLIRGEYKVSEREKKKKKPNKKKGLAGDIKLMSALCLVPFSLLTHFFATTPRRPVPEDDNMPPLQCSCIADPKPKKAGQDLSAAAWET